MESISRVLHCGDAEIRLGHGKAFGSGDHETTRSCLEFLPAISNLKGARVLDIGCGTGILAIAALKLGAGTAVAFDVDPDALETTRENANLNGVSDRLALYLGEITALRDTRFDVILANLYGDLLLTGMDRIASLLAPGGTLLMSGIQWEERYEIEQALARSGMRIEKVSMLQEYVTVRAMRNA